eukprot:8822977-Alexandrium_andersonii.AAC.1
MGGVYILDVLMAPTRSPEPRPATSPSGDGGADRCEEGRGDAEERRPRELGAGPSKGQAPGFARQGAA